MDLIKYNIVKLERAIVLQIYDMHDKLLEFLKEKETIGYEHISIHYINIWEDKYKISNDVIHKHEDRDVIINLIGKKCDEEKLNMIIHLKFINNEIRDEVFNDIVNALDNLIDTFKQNHPGITDSLITRNTTLKI